MKTCGFVQEGCADENHEIGNVFCQTAVDVLEDID